MLVLNISFGHVHRQGEENQAFSNPGIMKTKSKLIVETSTSNINIKAKNIFFCHCCILSNSGRSVSKAVCNLILSFHGHFCFPSALKEKSL
jgi:hypothetical protein